MIDWVVFTYVLTQNLNQEYYRWSDSSFLAHIFVENEPQELLKDYFII